jgi:trk system potassium uptake protein TrkH
MNQLLSKFLLYLAVLLLIPLGFATYLDYHSSTTMAFALTFLISLGLAYFFRRLSSKTSIHRRDGILLVVFIWLIACFIGSLPFVFSRTLNPLDAYFEAMSGFTTTGATLLCPKAYDANGDEIPHYITNPHVPDRTYIFYGTVPPIRDPETGLILHEGIEAVNPAILLWRSLMQWIGGLGIVVIFLSILPALQVGGKFLYQVEMTGPIKEGINPRVKSTSTHLWILYISLTVVEMILLYASKVPLFDSICLSLSNVSTGGFSVRNANFAAYPSPLVHWIVILFMIAGSINFSLYFQAIRGKFQRMNTPDFFLFLGIATLGCLLVSLSLLSKYPAGHAFREGIFQALSMQTTTGFIIANYDHWPFISQLIMLLLMFVGGMSGSTAGGIKTSRFYILFKIVQHRLESIYRPDAVRTLRIGNAEVDDKNALTVLSFFCIVAFFTVLGTTSLVLDGVDPETSLGLTACFLNNVGCSFRAAVDSFAFLSPISKILSIIWMLLGRLEYYVMLLLLLPSFWKNR